MVYMKCTGTRWQNANISLDMLNFSTVHVQRITRLLIFLLFLCNLCFGKLESILYLGLLRRVLLIVRDKTDCRPNP